MPPAALPEPGRDAPGYHAENRNRDNENEQRQRDAGLRIISTEGIERHRHQVAIGEREHDEKDTKRNQDQAGEEFAHDLSRDAASVGNRADMFTRRLMGPLP